MYFIMDLYDVNERTEVYYVCQMGLDGIQPK
jgi:hypothetical protein